MKEVRVGRWGRVYPSQILRIQVVPLRPLDNYYAYVSFQKKVLFFAQAGEDATSILKQSLAKALDYFYPLAGRLSFRVPDVQLQLHSNSGATFVEATTDATVSELGSEILPSEFIDALCQTEIVPEYPWREDYPLLSVQVTRFSCGGLSVGITFSHQICDGVAFWHFMNSWGEIARLGAPAVEPCLSYKIDEGRLPDVLPMTMVPAPRKDVIEAVKRTGWRKLKALDGANPSMMKLTREKLSELKADAPGCSTFEVSCAYLWQIVGKTWTLGKEDETSNLLISVNLRERTSWLSSNYFGNAVIPVAATITVAELQKGSLHSIAQFIHETIVEACTQESVEDGIRVMHEFDGNERMMTFAGGSHCKNICLVVGSPRHRIYDIDYGWGKVSNSTFGTNDLSPSKIYLFPSPHGGGEIDAIISSKHPHVDI